MKRHRSSLVIQVFSVSLPKRHALLSPGFGSSVETSAAGRRTIVGLARIFRGQAGLLFSSPLSRRCGVPRNPAARVGLPPRQLLCCLLRIFFKLVVFFLKCHGGSSKK